MGSECKEIGDIGRKTQIEWRIKNFLSVTEDAKIDYYTSPTFTIADVSLYLQLHPISWFYPQFISVCLISKSKPKHPVEYNIGFLKSDNSVLNFGGGVLKDNITDSGSFKTVKLSALRNRMAELAPSGILTVTCTLFCEVKVTHVTQKKIVLDQTIPSTLIKLEKLSDDFKDHFGDKETCDTTLKVQDKEFKAHRTVLMARSPVFAATFKHDTSEKQTGIITIPDCDPGSFQDFLEYLYCGKLEKMSYNSAFHLYNTSDKYDVQELKTFCAQSLVKCLTTKNVCEIVALADKYEETSLYTAAQDFFNANICEILHTSEWEYLLKKDHRLANKLMKEMSQAMLKK